MLKQIPLLTFIMASVLLQCQAPHKEVSHSLPYDFERPERIMELEKDLVEISGIVWWSEDTLAAIEDEKGKIYFLDSKDGKILHKSNFGEKGDYEDLAIRNKKIFVLKSNGNIFEVKNPLAAETKSRKKNTSLSKEDDAEGLCYDAKKDRFLIGVKEPGEYKGKRVVYEWKSGEKDIKKEPYLLIDENELVQRIHKKYGDRFGNNFKPSGLEFHPVTQELYIISAINRTLAVFDKKKKLKEAIRLPKKYSKQVEGICFSPDGTLFISTEGGDGKAKIAELKMR